MSNQQGKSSKALAIVLAVALVAVAIFAFVTNGQKADLQKKVDELTSQVTGLQGELDTAKTLAQETADAAAKAAEEAAAKAAEVAAAAEAAAAEAAAVVSGEVTEEAAAVEEAAAEVTEEAAAAEEAAAEVTEEAAAEVAAAEVTEEAAAEEVAAEATEEAPAEVAAAEATEEAPAEEAAAEVTEEAAAEVAAAEVTEEAAAEEAAVAAVSSAPAWAPYDELIAQIKAATDVKEREALMHQAEDMLMETGALIPIYYYNDIFLAKTDMAGYYSSPFGTKFFQHATKGDADALRIQLASEPDKLDPALNSTVDGATLAANTFGGLYTYDKDGNLAPHYAVSYELSEDGLTYVFTMRDDLKWSNGDPMTAKDFEYSWKRAVKDETAADYAYMFNGIEGYPENLNVVASEDGKTLTVKLQSPVAYFLDLVAFPTYFAVHEATVENAEGYKDAAGVVTNPGAWALEAGFVSSGPFMLTEWNHEESMVYTKNPNYYDAENVKVEKLELMLSADEVAIYAAYQAGDLDFIDTVPPDQIKTLIDTEEFHKVDELGTYYAIFNVNSPIFDGMTVEQAAAFRRAIGRLIDRQYIVDSVAQTGQVVATSFIPAFMKDGQDGVFKSNDGDFTYPSGTEEFPGYYPEEPSVEDAVALLKEAGLEVGEDNKLVNPMTLTYIYNTSASHQAIGELIQQDLAEVGIEVKLESQEWNVFLNERKAGNFDFARNGWIADFNDPINMLEMWTTDSGNNDAQFGR